MPLPPPRPCPCGAPRYDQCCGPLHLGAARAGTAEQLMRSRYSAYALGEEDYLLRTWHPRTRPASIDTPAGLEWTGLRILDTVDGGESDDEGVVAFRADHLVDGEAGALTERSRFARRGGRWVYVDGDTG